MDAVRRSEHWNSYYSSRAAPASPSQFGVFIHSEFTKALIVDFGCGSGRDSLFFADQGHSVIGVDASEQAVQTCTDAAGSRQNVSFIQADVSETETLCRLTEKLPAPPSEVLVYARFFLHAINPKEQESFFKLCKQLSHLCKVSLAVEFRTNRDQSLTKVTPEHYRRYIDPVDLISDAALAGFRPVYFVEGFGYAKFKNDDAHVARIIFSA